MDEHDLRGAEQALGDRKRADRVVGRVGDREVVGDHHHVTARDQELHGRLRRRRAARDGAHLHVVGEDRALEAKLFTQQLHGRGRKVGGSMRVDGGIEQMAEEHEVRGVRDGRRERRQVAGANRGQGFLDPWQAGLRAH